ncbi:MAG: hypothetical protein ACYDBQ_00795 [Thermoplasmatota archaeon]
MLSRWALVATAAGLVLLGGCESAPPAPPHAVDHLPATGDAAVGGNAGPLQANQPGLSGCSALLSSGGSDAVLGLCDTIWHIHDGVWNVAEANKTAPMNWDTLWMRAGTDAEVGLQWYGAPGTLTYRFGGARGDLHFADVWPVPVSVGQTLLMCRPGGGQTPITFWDSRPIGAAIRVSLSLPPCMTDGVPGWFVDAAINLTLTQANGPVVPLQAGNNCVSVSHIVARWEGRLTATWAATTPAADQLTLAATGTDNSTATTTGPSPLEINVAGEARAALAGVQVPTGGAAINQTVQLHAQMIFSVYPGSWPAGATVSGRLT